MSFNWKIRIPKNPTSVVVSKFQYASRNDSYYDEYSIQETLI